MNNTAEKSKQNTEVCYSLRVLRRAPEADWRCLGFPPAGAGPMFFQSWRDVLSERFQLEAINLPGREMRMTEPMPQTMGALVEEVFARIVESLEPDPRPVLMFGHSFGGLLAYEVLRLFSERGVRHPVAFCVSAHCAPMFRTPVGALHRLDDDSLVSVLQRFDGVPQELRDNKEFLAMCLPVIRGDLQLDYASPLRTNNKIDQPILIVAGRDDHVAPLEFMRGWESMTSGHRQFISFPGHHFYLLAQLKSVMAELERFSERVFKKN
ncbi:alpha/beta fold hydrolase [Pectobacterium betavasculorum]|nr:alpha/beta fold hydrolase [Pectobacterium betavasculorum]